MFDLALLLVSDPGMVLSFGLFLLSQGITVSIDKSKNKKERKQLFDSNIARKYLEWCRKQDHKMLLKEMNSQTEHLIEIVSQLDSIEIIISEIQNSLEEEFSDVKDIFKELSTYVRKPVLSPIPLHCRNIINRQLLFRDKDLKLLKNH